MARASESLCGVGGQDFIADRGSLQRVPDAFCDVILRPPAQQAHRAVDTGIGAVYVAWPSSSLACFDGPVGYLVERVPAVPYRGARTQCRG